MPIEGIQPPGDGPLPLLEAAALRAVGEAQLNLQPGEVIQATVLGTTAQKAVLDLKGSPVSVDRAPGLEAGMQVLVRVTGLTPQPTLELEPFVAGAGKRAPSLHVGEEVEGKLLEQVASDRFLIDIAGNQLEAVVPDGIADGQPVRFRVAEVEPQLVLHAFDSGAFIEGEMVSLIRAHLGESSPAGAAWANLQQALEPFAAGVAVRGSQPSLSQLHAFLQTILDTQAAPDAEKIAHLVRDGGLQYEAKLARLVEGAAPGPDPTVLKDLKGLLLRAQQELTAAAPAVQGSAFPVPAASTHGSQSLLPSAAAHAPPTLSALVTSHLGRLETQQALNLLAQMHGTPYQFQIPVFTGNGFSTVYLGIEPDAHGKEQGQEDSVGGFNLFFHLDLENYGETRIDARIAERTIRVNFFVAQAQAVTEVRSELPALQEALRSLGFNEILLAADSLDHFPPDKSSKTAALAAGVPSGVHLLDVKV